MNRRVVSVVVGFAVGVAVLAGCTAPAVEPSPSPSVSVTPSPSVSPTPTLTAEEQLLAQIPEGAKGDDLLAAVEMAKFFLLLQPDLYRGGDPALWEFLSLPDCTFCSSTVTSTAQRVRDEHLQVGGEYAVPEQVVGSVLDTKTDDTTTALIQFDFTEAAYQIVAEDGTVIKTGGPGTHRATLALRLEDGLWRVFAAAVD
jgi:hypothetical protein